MVLVEVRVIPYRTLKGSVTASVADPDPGSGAFLTPGPGSGIRNRFFPDPGSRISDPGSRIPDLGLRIPDSGSRIPDSGSRIPDPKPIFLRA